MGRRRPLATPEPVLRHWPLGLVATAATGLLLTGLGTPHLWEDEGDTAVLAASILQHGVPVAWDGVTFTAPDYGQRLTHSFVMVSHPWLQYYLAAASFALFGESPAAARLPFALAGLATIILVYVLMVDLRCSRLAALSAAVLLTLNVQFLLYAQQARNYSVHAFLTCLLVWQFLRLESWGRAVAFAAIGILLFHAHPLGLAVLAALGLVSLMDASRRASRAFFWPAAAVVALYSAPWLWAAQRGYRPNLTLLTNLRLFVPRLLQFVVEAASVTPLVGVAALGLYVAWRRLLMRAPADQRHRQPKVGLAPARSLMLACLSVIAVEAIIMAATHSRQAMWVEGLHQTPALIPLILIVTGILIATVSATRPIRWAVLLLVFGATRLPQVTPWVSAAAPRPDPNPRAMVSFHVPPRPADRVLRTTELHYVRSLFADNPGVIAHVSEFLNRNASPSDVVVTNYAWESLYFHTRLPQAIKVAPSFPIYAAVREARLPDYVFSPAGVRWVVWRQAWPAFFAEQNLARLLMSYRDAGFSTRLAASIPETLYENRENIHFHRFARDTYVFPHYRNLPSTLIYRIETFEESIAHYRRQLAATPDDVDTLTNLAVALVGSGRIERAVAVFYRAAEAAPGDARAQRNLANALFDTRRVAEAVGPARLAVVLNPDDALAHDVLGRVLALEGHLGEAVQQLEWAVRLDSQDREIRDHLERVRRLNSQLSGTQ